MRLQLKLNIFALFCSVDEGKPIESSGSQVECYPIGIWLFYVECGEMEGS